MVTISFPQSHRQRQPRRKPLRMGEGRSVGPRTSKRPKRCPVISLAELLFLEARTQPQLRVGLLEVVRALCSTEMRFPQSHWQSQRRVGFPPGDLYGFGSSAKTSRCPKRRPVRSSFFIRSPHKIKVAGNGVTGLYVVPVAVVVTNIEGG